MDLLRTLQQACHPEGVRLDVGANVGGHTHLMRQHGPGEIHAFEPIPALYDGVCERFADDPNISVYPQAVSDWVGEEGGYRVHEAWTLAKPEGAVRGLNATWGGQLLTLQFTTLDHHLATRCGEGARVDFIKIDTDGYEPHVLRGAEALLQRDRPPILIEFGYCIADLGEDIPAWMDRIYHQYHYQVLQPDGTRSLTPEAALARYPWHTTWDVGLVPEAWDRPLLD